jgi:hypothetical protein
LGLCINSNSLDLTPALSEGEGGAWFEFVA